MNVQWKPVKNYWKGRGGYTPRAVVVHIAQGYLAGGYSWFNNPASGVSAHYMIGRNGEIWQFVAEEDSAWHAGGVANPTALFVSNFPAGVNPNLYTIGIEHEGFTGERWPKAQIDASAWLIAEIHKRWKLGSVRYPQTLIGHNEINTLSRGSCPGTGVHITNDLILNANKLLNAGGSTKPKDDNLYKIIKDGKQIGAFTDKDNTLDMYLNNNKSVTVKYNNKDVTNTFKDMANQLQNQINSLKSEITSLQSLNTNLTTEKNSLNSKINSLNSQINDLKSSNTKLKSDYDRLGRDNEKLKKEIVNLRKASGMVVSSIDTRADGNSRNIFGRFVDALRGDRETA